jgi:hypothetical protein
MVVSIVLMSWTFFFKSNNLTRKKATPHTPEKNGVVERLNQTLMEKARSMKVEASLSKEFWVEAIAKPNY